jgi:putative ABC transport system permease protein
VRTSIADIDLVQTLDRSLSIVYWIIALIASAGYCLSFATSVWANVDRKRREFSVLRLTGFRTRAIVWFPILQAAFTATSAWGLACLVVLAVQTSLNALFANSIAGGEPVCLLQPWHLVAALAMTLAAAAIAATIGGQRVAHPEPSIGLRES